MNGMKLNSVSIYYGCLGISCKYGIQIYAIIMKSVKQIFLVFYFSVVLVPNVSTDKMKGLV